MVDRSKTMPGSRDAAHPVNSCVFEGAQPLINGLISSIKDETILWAKASATGLGVVTDDLGCTFVSFPLFFFKNPQEICESFH
jgi:hypothetical protein